MAIAPPTQEQTDLHTSTTAVDDIGDVLERAARRIAPLWKLENFVAVNPYLGMTEMRFDEAARRLAVVAGARSTLPAQFYLDALAEGRVDRQDVAAALTASGRRPGQDIDRFLTEVGDAWPTSGPAVRTLAGVAAATTGTDWDGFMVDRVAAWAAAYFDDGQAMWRSADRGLRPLAAWRSEASIDRTPDVMGLKGFRRHVALCPDDPRQAAAAALEILGVPPGARELYLHALLLRLAGWSAFAARIVWDAELAGGDDDTLVQFLAVLVCWEAALLEALRSPELDAAWARAVDELDAAAVAAPMSDDLEDLLVLQEAFDRATQRALIAKIDQNATTTSARASSPAAVRPRAQAVFCIDVRSEVLRRHLEAVAPDVETVGFAGFFGIPIEFRPLAHADGVAQCPVLLTPGHVVAESVTDPTLHSVAVARRGLTHQVRRAWKSFKMGAISCFSFVGPVGLIYLPKLFTDAFGRTQPVRRAEVEGLGASMAATARPTLEPVVGHVGSGIAPDDRVRLAEGALRAMSLTEGMAPVVLITGHGSSTVNNPYDNGLDCGACGGHTGEANARVAAMILNDPDVRAALRGKGIAIPDDTCFLAALHDTTTDVVSFFDVSALPPSHQELVQAIDRDLREAGRRARGERARRLGVADARDVDAAVMARSTDWAQVRPEWGLAGCSAFVAAPRARTAHTDLEGRSFLHSYDWRSDDGFGVLELIMTAPMVVASWISLQYYGSTVDNRLFGSGNKTLHNVVGKVGVLEGTAGDLRTGLPWQSVHDGTSYQHEPVRLNVVIEAPLDAMNGVIAHQPGVRALVDNGWVQLLAMDDSGRIAHRYIGDFGWEDV